MRMSLIAVALLAPALAGRDHPRGLIADGVSIHSSNIRWSVATHGCVAIPKAFAAKVFEVVKVGNEVPIVSTSRARES
jgi:hypothetical protein